MDQGTKKAGHDCRARIADAGRYLPEKRACPGVDPGHGLLRPSAAWLAVASQVGGAEGGHIQAAVGNQIADAFCPLRIA
jgi:hypothetical protein